MDGCVIGSIKVKIFSARAKNYPIGNCAEVDAINRLVQKGSAIQDIRISATYKNSETLKSLRRNGTPVEMKSCEYCKFMFESN